MSVMTHGPLSPVRPENLKRFTDVTFSAIILTLDKRTSAPADVLW
jgi:hypothetical protein